QLASFNPLINFATGTVSQIHGVRIKNLAQSVTDEVLLKIFLSQNLMSNITSFKVDRHKNTKESFGTAFAFFKDQDSAVDARRKLIGQKIHNQEINVIMIMKPEELKLMNECNIYLKQLPHSMALSGLNQAFEQLGLVTSCKIVVKDGLTFGYVQFKNSSDAQRACSEGVKHQDQTLMPTFLKREKQQQPEFGKMSNNVILQFRYPLLAYSSEQYVTFLKQSVAIYTQSHITSVFVWGGLGKDKESEEEQGNNCFQHAQCFREKKCVTEKGDINQCCYEIHFVQKKAGCSYLHKAQSRAFCCFLNANDANNFMSNFFQDKEKNVSSLPEILQDVEYVIPHNRAAKQEIKQKLLKHFKQSNYIYLKNLKSDVSEQTLREIIEKEVGTQVQSIRLSRPSQEDYMNENKQTSQYATLILKDGPTVQKFLEDFKKNQDLRSKFSTIYNGDYKYMSKLLPKYEHKIKLKESFENKKTKIANHSHLNSCNFNKDTKVNSYLLQVLLLVNLLCNQWVIIICPDFLLK
ncbi:poly binding protein 6 pab6 RNA binding translation initiation factor, putative, partial [Ichthyophthirius multifiliis]